MDKYDRSSVLPALAGARLVFARQQRFAEHCMAQLDDAQFFAALYPGCNSVAVIAQHLGGNMLSRWTDFLTTDGEKPDRDRDREFAAPPDREQVMDDWHRGWAALFTALDALKEDDLMRTVTIRGVPHSVVMAVTRQLDHYGYHVGQIATIARGLVGTEKWQWFTIPPGGSAAFNRLLGHGVKP